MQTPMTRDDLVLALWLMIAGWVIAVAIVGSAIALSR